MVWRVDGTPCVPCRGFSVSKRPFVSDVLQRRSTLQKDFVIFLEPGLLITLVLMLLLGTALTGVLLYSTTKYAIPPF